MAPICQNILLCNVYYSSNSFCPACMSDIIKWILVSTGGNAYSKSVYEYPLIKQTALDSKYTPQILQMSCVRTYSSGTRMYINTCVTQRIINLKEKNPTLLLCKASAEWASFAPKQAWHFDLLKMLGSNLRHFEAMFVYVFDSNLAHLI